MLTNYSKIKNNIKKTPLNNNLEGLAFFTHYLQNIENNISEIYLKHVLNHYDGLDINFKKVAWDIPFPPPKDYDFTFIDLFAGIGGFRIPLQELGGKCVFSSEFNEYAQKAYEINFGEVPFGDITKIDLNIVPEHDVLCAGFPCQPFSISGKMKGFEDTRGTLIYHVFKIIEKISPKVVFLENVKHLANHDKKKTLNTIVKNLEDLGYFVSIKVLNASDFGIPQNRERIIIIASKNEKFDFSKITKKPRPQLKHFLDKKNDFEFLNEPFTILENQKTQSSGLIFAGYRNKKIRKSGVRDGTEHLSRVHKQPNRIYSSEGVHPTLPSQESSGRFWIWHKNRVRKLTIDECYRIMGYPKNFKKINIKSELYKQIGNSVAIPMIKAIGEQIKGQLLKK